MSPKAQGFFAIAESAKQHRTYGLIGSLIAGTCGERGRFYEVKPVRLVPNHVDRPGLTAQAAARVLNKDQSPHTTSFGGPCGGPELCPKCRESQGG